MSAVTLEKRLQQLLDEFEAETNLFLQVAIDSYLANRHEWTPQFVTNRHLVFCGKFNNPQSNNDWPPYVAARRYIIARDFNEFDPKRADMLWKLANGGAL